MKREGGGKGARLSWHEYGISLKSGSNLTIIAEEESTNQGSHLDIVKTRSKNSV